MDVVFFEEIPVGRANQVNGTYPNRFDLCTELFEAKWTHGPGTDAMVDVAFECVGFLFLEIQGGERAHCGTAEEHFFKGGASSRVEGHVGQGLVLGFNFFCFENSNEK
jgi:hypothetical protein